MAALFQQGKWLMNFFFQKRDLNLVPVAELLKNKNFPKLFDLNPGPSVNKRLL